MAGISPSPELIDDAACELIGISPERAGEYVLALAADGLELPEGWSASDPYRGLVGWDVILIAPRSLSILRCDLVDYWFSRREYRLSVEGADPDTVECDPDRSRPTGARSSSRRRTCAPRGRPRVSWPACSTPGRRGCWIIRWTPRATCCSTPTWSLAPGFAVAIRWRRGEWRRWRGG